jgi:hypothetical protein
MATISNIARLSIRRASTGVGSRFSQQSPAFHNFSLNSPLLIRQFSRAPKRVSKAGGSSITKNIDPWVAVQDPAGTGQIYWWNQNTDETTPLNAPKPGSGPPPPSSSSVSIPAPGNITNANPMMAQPAQPGLMGVMAQGFAFGTGSAVAHSMVGSMFGGGGGGHSQESSSNDSGSGDADDFDL